MKALLKKLWKKSQSRAFGFNLTIGRITVRVWWSWLGVFLWGAVLVWIVL